MSLSRFIPVFSGVFPLIYVPVMAWNYPLATYLPRSGEWHLGFVPNLPPVAAPGPGMFFWGWMGTTAIIAAIIGIIGSFLPEKIVARVIPIVPFTLAYGVIGLVYALRQWWVF